MKFDVLPQAEIQPGDSQEMIKAIRALVAAGFDVRRPEGQAHQLKASPKISYYPGRGTIFFDSDKRARPERGLEALVALLHQMPSD